MEPELEAVLLECHEQADDERVTPVSEHNLYAKMVKVIEGAGLDPGKDPFHALRRMRESDWMQDHPAAYVHDWLGHSGAVSQEAYASTPDSYFAKASEPAEQLKRSIDQLNAAEIDLVQTFVDELKSKRNGATSAQQTKNEASEA